MEHRTLYRKWRPTTFSEVVGQEQVTDVLRYEVANGKTTHAYLFCGSRGTGKTTCAKILAKAVNCLNPVGGDPCGKCEACRLIDSGAATDIIEMDAASNNGVDDIRDIRDTVVYAPAALKNRVYIIDEVHMLSSSAFNALLKTLEEPPPQVIFILATTETQKIPATILSRCQKHDFRRISTPSIVKRLMYIAANENIELKEDAAALIARLSQGGMRDAISLLELCASDGLAVDVKTVRKVAGIGSREMLAELVAAVGNHNYDSIFSIIADLVGSSVDIAVFWQELIGYYRDMMIYKTVKESKAYLDVTDDELADIARSASTVTREKLLWQSDLLEKAYFNMQRSPSTALKRACAEMTLIKMADERLDDRTDAIIVRLAALENAIKNGSAPQSATGITKNTVSEAGCEGSKVSGDTVPPAGRTAENTIEGDTEYSAGEKSPSSDSDSFQNAADKAFRRPGERTLSVFTDWAEAIGTLKDSDSSLLRQVKAYTDGSGRLILVASNAFSKNMIDRDTVKESICGALNRLDDTHAFTPSDISVELKKENLTADDPFTDFRAD